MIIKFVLESFELDKDLSSTSRASLYQYDSAPLDLNKLGVYLFTANND